MKQITVYHNPRCSKSRKTLALVREQGIEPIVIEYLKTPPDVATLEQIVESLDGDPLQLIRPKEHRALGLADTSDRRELIRRMAEHPEIIERPIVVCCDRARIGRPPEAAIEIL